MNVRLIDKWLMNCTQSMVEVKRKKNPENKKQQDPVALVQRPGEERKEHVELDR